MGSRSPGLTLAKVARRALRVRDFVNSFTIPAIARSISKTTLLGTSGGSTKMRFYGLALLAGAAVLGACGGGEKPADTTAAAAPATPAPATPAPAANALPKIAATGTTVEVKMVGDDKGYRF